MPPLHPAELLLLAAVIPLWIAAGLADWACHRATRIQATSGLPENLLHWLLFAQMGVAVLGILLLEASPGLLSLVAGAFLLHEATVYLELRYAVPRRPVRPLEQMVHSFQELLALAALGLLAVLGWDGLRGLAAGAPWDLALRLKARPWPPAAVVAAIAGALLLNVLPLAEETLRCLRSRTRARPAPT